MIGIATARQTPQGRAKCAVVRLIEEYYCEEKEPPAEFEDIKGTPVINPGETSGVLTGKRTVVLLDVATLDVEIVEL